MRGRFYILKRTTRLIYLDLDFREDCRVLRSRDDHAYHRKDNDKKRYRRSMQESTAGDLISRMTTILGLSIYRE